MEKVGRILATRGMKKEIRVRFSGDRVSSSLRKTYCLHAVQITKSSKSLTLDFITYQGTRLCLSAAWAAAASGDLSDLGAHSRDVETTNGAIPDRKAFCSYILVGAEAAHFIN